MDKHFLIIDGTAQTWEDAIHTCAGALKESGFVKDSFAQACIEREKVYPTGLGTEPGVAIPHTGAEHVNENAFCLLRLKEPVRFCRMDDPDEETDVYFVFNLAICDPEKQLNMLRAIMKLVQDGDYMAHLLELPPDAFCESISSRLAI